MIKTKRGTMAGAPAPEVVSPDEIARLRREVERLRAAAEYVAHAMGGARIWNGTDWHYNPLHPRFYRAALDRLREALDGT